MIVKFDNVKSSNNRSTFFPQPEYPILKVEEKTGMVVMLTSARKGVVLVKGESKYPVGFYSDNWLDWFFKDLPKDMTITLFN